MRYLISYDLHRVKDYTRLLIALRAMGAVKIHQSFWGVTSNMTHRAITLHLNKMVDGDDSVLVMQAPPPNGWSSVRMRSEAVSFLSGYPVFGSDPNRLGLAALFR